MLSLPPSVKIYASTQPMNMRCTYNGLSAAVERVLKEKPLSGHLFVFFNRRGDQCRCIYWDRNGYVMFGKRLSRGRFKLPWEGEYIPGSKFELEASELTLILGGIDLKGAKKRKRWKPGQPLRKRLKA